MALETENEPFCRRYRAKLTFINELVLSETDMIWTSWVWLKQIMSDVRNYPNDFSWLRLWAPCISLKRRCRSYITEFWKDACPEHILYLFPPQLMHQIPITIHLHLPDNATPLFFRCISQSPTSNEMRKTIPGAIKLTSRIPNWSTVFCSE